jgi:hypothetical protein
MEDEEPKKFKFKRAPSFSNARYRNLAQYKNLSDDEFEEVMAQKYMGIKMDTEFEDRINRKLTEFSQDYDLDEMNINDRLILRSLCQAIINLEDVELAEYAIRKEGFNEGNILLLSKMGDMKTSLSIRISKAQDDLKITRRVRKADKEQSVINYLEDLKKKAKEEYTAKMGIILCPKCGTWLSSCWSLYKNPKDRIILTCNRKFPDGTTCGEKINISIKELYDMGGCNRKDLLPESLR